ncbi:MAG: 30S ribosomal protein S12 methylthiotransferase RimO [Candidatus Omnitrophica bacterium]|nr:30S ribosomal protein S12 methylthiotransferase RimO [Candidatus Omnitrophota bacterium]
MKKPTIGIISLGCPRNMVDSEVMLGILKKDGYCIMDGLENCDIALINTCAFIEEAKEEAIDIILKAAQLKNEGRIKSIIVAGCLPQRYSDTLKKQIPEVDAFLGVCDFDKIKETVLFLSRHQLRQKQNHPIYFVTPPTKIYSHKLKRYLLTPNFYTYIKIAEGCNNNCSYCAIYKIRGKYRSRPMESIIMEIKAIGAMAHLSELNIIAQDTTSYGRDIYKKYKLAELLKKIAALDKAHWIRLLYTHPGHFTDELIETIRSEKSICKYIDLPMQHANNRILKMMNRNTTKGEIIKLIQKIKSRIPGVALRTSVIVGFPGETDKEFKELLDFIKDTKFERLGAFVYSREEHTKAYDFKKQIPERIKRQRLDEVMKLQQDVSAKINKRWMGKTLEVLIEEKENDVYTGRSQYDAPEVDGTVFVKGKNLKIGGFKKVKITDTLEYDLAGEVL